MNNLINDKNYADEIAEMKQKLKETREKYKDSETLDNQYIELYKDKE